MKANRKDPPLVVTCSCGAIWKGWSALTGTAAKHIEDRGDHRVSVEWTVTTPAKETL